MREETKRRYLRIANMVKRGKSVKDTAKHFKCATTTVCVACDSFGVIRKTKQGGEGKLSNRTYKIIAEIVNGDDMYKDIAEKYDVTSAHVRGVAKRLRNAGCRVIELRQSGAQKQ